MSRPETTKRERSDPSRWDITGVRFRIGTRILQTIARRGTYLRMSHYERNVWDRAYWMGWKGSAENAG